MLLHKSSSFVDRLFLTKIKNLYKNKPLFDKFLFIICKLQHNTGGRFFSG